MWEYLVGTMDWGFVHSPEQEHVFGIEYSTLRKPSMASDVAVSPDADYLGCPLTLWSHKWNDCKNNTYCDARDSSSPLRHCYLHNGNSVSTNIVKADEPP